MLCGLPCNFSITKNVRITVIIITITKCQSGSTNMTYDYIMSYRVFRFFYFNSLKLQNAVKISLSNRNVFNCQVFIVNYPICSSSLKTDKLERSGKKKDHFLLFQIVKVALGLEADRARDIIRQRRYKRVSTYAYILP